MINIINKIVLLYFVLERNTVERGLSKHQLIEVFNYSNTLIISRSFCHEKSKSLSLIIISLGAVTRK